MVDCWDKLRREMDLWASAGGIATLWWRDDDATSLSDRLMRMIDIADDVVVTLAVIAGQANDTLVKFVEEAPPAVVVQHGWVHINHAPRGEKKVELSLHRGRAVVLHEIEMGRVRISEMFGAHSMSVLVPPWNRIEKELVPELPALGVTGLSTHGPRSAVRGVQGIVLANTHVDLMDWKSGPCFIGDDAAIARLVAHLEARRSGDVDKTEPTGILTHHQIHDSATESFLKRLLSITKQHSSTKWLHTGAVFAASLQSSARVQ
jgi:hypothetical protein